MTKKWLAAIPPYLAVWAGLFIFHSAWAALVGFHIAILLSLFWLRPTLNIATLFKTSNPKFIFPSVLLCASGGLGLYLFWDVFQVTADLPERLSVLGLSGATWVGFVVYFSLVNPLFEEYFWRGALGSDVRGFYIGDLVYAGYHTMIVMDKTPFHSVLIMLVVLISIGWFWRQAYRKDGGLLVPVLGHMAADFMILLAVWFKVMR